MNENTLTSFFLSQDERSFLLDVCRNDKSKEFKVSFVDGLRILMREYMISKSMNEYMFMGKTIVERGKYCFMCYKPVENDNYVDGPNKLCSKECFDKNNWVNQF